MTNYLRILNIIAMYTNMKGSTNVEELHRLTNDLSAEELAEQLDKLNHMGLIQISGASITIKKQI
jgi:DNA-binding HxlR family transcriptional regulator